MTCPLLEERSCIAPLWFGRRTNDDAFFCRPVRWQWERLWPDLPVITNNWGMIPTRGYGILSRSSQTEQNLWRKRRCTTTDLQQNCIRLSAMPSGTKVESCRHIYMSCLSDRFYMYSKKSRIRDGAKRTVQHIHQKVQKLRTKQIDLGATSTFNRDQSAGPPLVGRMFLGKSTMAGQHIY